jgi:hypothetical protein
VALLGEHVLDPYRGLRVDPPLHDAFGFQLLQPFGEQLVREVGDRVDPATYYGGDHRGYTDHPASV